MSKRGRSQPGVTGPAVCAASAMKCCTAGDNCCEPIQEICCPPTRLYLTYLTYHQSLVMESQGLAPIPELEGTPTCSKDFNKTYKTFILLTVYIHEEFGTNRKPRRLQLFRSPYRDLASLEQSLAASSIQTSNVIVECEDYLETTGVTCVPAALCGYLDSIIDHRVDPCTDEEYHAPCRLISSSCCSERGHNRVTFDVLVRQMEGRKPSTQSVRPPSSQHQVSSDPSITRASEDKSKTDAKSVSIPSLTATFKSHRTGTAPEDRVREASHHFSEKDSEIRNAAANKYLPLGSDARGMLRFKDHNIDRQRGRGALKEGEAGRELTEADMDNAAYTHLGCVAATGQVLSTMFEEGSGYHVLLKHLYDRHSIEYAAKSGSTFRPYHSVKAPVDILTRVKNRPSQHVNNRTKLKGAAARPYDKDAAAIQKWEADVKPTFVLINDLDVKNEKTPSLNSELERTIRSRCAHSEVAQKIGMHVLLGLAPDFETVLRLMQSYGVRVAGEVKAVYKAPTVQPAPTEGLPDNPVRRGELPPGRIEHTGDYRRPADIVDQRQAPELAPGTGHQQQQDEDSSSGIDEDPLLDLEGGSASRTDESAGPCDEDEGGDRKGGERARSGGSRGAIGRTGRKRVRGMDEEEAGGGKAGEGRAGVRQKGVRGGKGGRGGKAGERGVVVAEKRAADAHVRGGAKGRGRVRS